MINPVCTTYYNDYTIRVGKLLIVTIIALSVKSMNAKLIYIFLLILIVMIIMDIVQKCQYTMKFIGISFKHWNHVISECLGCSSI